MGGMTDQPTARSVKIDADERGAWSSDRPRTNRPPRPADISTRCRVLAPTDRMRYSPGSLLVIVCPAADVRDRFAERVIEDRNAVLSLAKVRKLLTGRVAEEELEDRAGELLGTAIQRRLENGDAVVYLAEGLDAAEREPLLHAAAALRRPRHALLVEPPRDALEPDDVPVLNELRRALDAGELGQEGFQTAMRVGGTAAADLKKIVFRPAPKDD
jgi:hypothetical protein